MVAPRVRVLGLVGAASIAALALAGGLWSRRTQRRALARPGRVSSAFASAEAAPGVWPASNAPLRAPIAASMRRTLRVALDPGHGARDNAGNRGAFCIDEQDAMMQLAVDVADRLEASGHVLVRLSREPGATIDYASRLAEAKRFGADAFVSLHSDVRGQTERWTPAPGMDCPLALDAPGFAVLFSDEGDAGAAKDRRSLSHAAARRMIEAGFAPYGGGGYVGLYAEDEQGSGVFVDRHAPGQRIFVLRRASMPAILIETHNALDAREAQRWTEPETIDAFAAALLAALGDAIPWVGPLRERGPVD